MDEVKHLTNKNSVYQIAKALKKITQSIRAEKNVANTKESNIKEIDFLKEYCLPNENIQLSLLAYQTFVRLVEDGTLDAAYVLSMFISMMPGSSAGQYLALSEGIVSLLLIDLKRRTILRLPNSTYRCPFGLRPPQHPLIMLLQKNDVNMNDLAHKINGICNHHDKDIQLNSIEFLRPVFLYILCNPNVVFDSTTIWTSLLVQCTKSPSAEQLFYDILRWRNTNTDSSCLFTSILLSESINFWATNEKKQTETIDLTIYLVAVIGDLIRWGYDPRPGLAITMNMLYKWPEAFREHFNLLLILLAHILHSISPVYLGDLTRIFKFIIITEKGGNRITCNMIVDGLISWLANPSFCPADGLADSKALIAHIAKHGRNNNLLAATTTSAATHLKHFHIDIAIADALAKASERLIVDDAIELKKFIEQIKHSGQRNFCDKINLFLRGLLLADGIPERVTLDLIEIVGEIVDRNQLVAIEFLMPWLYRLSTENTMTTTASVQLELLRGVVRFASVKENVPIVLNTLKSMSTAKALRPLAMNLYLRLWKCESRTYSFLHTLLSSNDDAGKSTSKTLTWELNVAKAHTIKEICELKPAQHGTDLVVHLSNILNESIGAGGDAATAIALDAIVTLCYNHTVNIASTWKALSVRFQDESRLRPVISLCNFFGKVPQLRSSTIEYEQLHAFALAKLWHNVQHSTHTEVVVASLAALKNFDFTDLPLLSLPPIYRQNLNLPSEFTKQAIDSGDPDRKADDFVPYIPGECWLQLIEQIQPAAIEAASDLVSHIIRKEIEAFRSGVYTLPEGHPEPNSLSRLSARSTLRALVRSLIHQSTRMDDRILEFSLRILAAPYPKPIPPLNWFFLLDFMGHSCEIRMVCLRLAANQLVQSGSAKNLLENYLTEFRAESCSAIEVEHCFQLLPLLIGGGIAANVWRCVVENLLKFSWEQQGGFEMALQAFGAVMQKAGSSGGSDMENVTVLAESVMSYLANIDDIVDDCMFRLFMEMCSHVPTELLEQMLAMRADASGTSKRFRKITLIRCYLAGQCEIVGKSLTWLNPVLDVVEDGDFDFVLHQIHKVLLCHDNHRNVCNYSMDLLGKIQASLLSPTSISTAKCLFLLDIFIAAIIVSSGLSTLYSKSDRITHLSILAESLALLSERDYWSSNVTRIYEFFHHIYVSDDKLPDNLRNAALSVLCAAKFQSAYFHQPAIWMKLVGLRVTVDPK